MLIVCTFLEQILMSYATVYVEKYTFYQCDIIIVGSYHQTCKSVVLLPY